MFVRGRSVLCMGFHVIYFTATKALSCLDFVIQLLGGFQLEYRQCSLSKNSLTCIELFLRYSYLTTSAVSKSTSVGASIDEPNTLRPHIGTSSGFFSRANLMNCWCGGKRSTNTRTKILTIKFPVASSRHPLL